MFRLPFGGHGNPWKLPQIGPQAIGKRNRSADTLVGVENSNEIQKLDEYTSNPT